MNAGSGQTGHTESSKGGYVDGELLKPNDQPYRGKPAQGTGTAFVEKSEPGHFNFQAGATGGLPSGDSRGTPAFALDPNSPSG